MSKELLNRRNVIMGRESGYIDWIMNYNTSSYIPVSYIYNKKTRFIFEFENVPNIVGFGISNRKDLDVWENKFCGCVILKSGVYGGNIIQGRVGKTTSPTIQVISNFSQEESANYKIYVTDSELKILKNGVEMPYRQRKRSGNENDIFVYDNQLEIFKSAQGSRPFKFKNNRRW
jgi:hypothetical protein